MDYIGELPIMIFWAFFNLSGFTQDDIVGDKKRKADIYNGAITLSVDYNNTLIYSEVEVSAESSLFIPSFLKKYDWQQGTSNIQSCSYRDNGISQNS